VAADLEHACKQGLAARVGEYALVDLVDDAFDPADLVEDGLEVPVEQGGGEGVAGEGADLFRRRPMGRECDAAFCSPGALGAAEDLIHD